MGESSHGLVKKATRQCLVCSRPELNIVPFGQKVHGNVTARVTQPVAYSFTRSENVSLRVWRTPSLSKA